MVDIKKVVELLVLTSVMGLSSFAGGFIPLKIPMTSSKINYISLFSMGILIGTSLVLIIPEGVSTLYESLEPENQKHAPKYLGISLLVGFLLMYIIDGLPAILSSLRLNVTFSYSANQKSNPSVGDILKSIIDSSLTLGLLFHALIDGISLGSSFFASDVSFQIFFFIAIIIHKLPTSFSLTSILLKENLNPKIILVHLILFALATPLSSIVTFFIISLTNSNNHFVIGILFLFSAGTFLYVVNHVIAEVTSASSSSSKSDFEAIPPTTNESGDTFTEDTTTADYYAEQEHNNHHHPKLSALEIAVSVAGMLVPILMSFFSSD